MFSAKLLKLWIFKDMLLNTYQSIHTIQVPSVLNVPSALDKLSGQLGNLRNLVILNCLLAKTIGYFHIFFTPRFLFL